MKKKERKGKRKRKGSKKCDEKLTAKKKSKYGKKPENGRTGKLYMPATCKEFKGLSCLCSIFKSKYGSFKSR